MPTVSGVGSSAGLSTAIAISTGAFVDPFALLLPPLTLPASSGAFRREGHTIEMLPLYGDAPMQTGSARRRRVYLATPRMVTVSLEVTQTGVREFAAWFEGPLRAGTNYFSAQVANQGPGLLWWKARVIAAQGQKPYQTDYLGGVWWKISMKLMLFGDGSTTGPASTALSGGVTFALTGTTVLSALQPLSGGVTFALLPVTAAVGGILSGSVVFALLTGTYTAPAPRGSAAGTSTANAVVASPATGSAAGTSTAVGASVNTNPAYPDEKGTWVSSTGALTAAVNDIPIYFKRARTIVGVSLVTLGGVGSCVVDIWKVAVGSYPPVVGNSICASAKPTIAAGRTYVDTTLTGWTTAVAAGDTMMLHVQSTSTFTLIAIKLHFKEL